MTQPDCQSALRQAMRARYGVALDRIRFVWSPYRVCPLGAHIDHQLGTVTAFAIDQGTWLAFAPSGSSKVRLSSLSLPNDVAIDLAHPPPEPAGDWGDYARGAVRALSQRTQLRQGMVGVTSGGLREIGLSSSASVGVAYLLALEEVNNITLSAAANIHLDQIIENQYLGLKNGILDQSAILLSRRQHLTVIDCRAFASQTAKDDSGSLPTGVQRIRPSETMPPFCLLLAVSGLTQPVVSTDYNQRVGECREAARILLAAAGRGHTAPYLGNVSLADYETHRAGLPPTLARRARHFFSEMQRVQAGIQAWRQGDLAEFGRWMNASGKSSICDYQCGSRPLIDLYRILRRTPGIYGARFSGAGFRGCCVALAEPSAAAAAIPAILEAYAKRHPEHAARASCILCQPDDGARIL